MIKRIALVFGIVFLLIGVAGFLTPGGMSMGVDPAAMLLGLFPVNLLHNIVHVVFGVWGIVASRSSMGARAYARVGGVIYLVLAPWGSSCRTASDSCRWADTTSGCTPCWRPGCSLPASRRRTTWCGQNRSRRREFERGRSTGGASRRSGGRDVD